MGEVPDVVDAVQFLESAGFVTGDVTIRTFLVLGISP
jgi:hypothetical protein